MSNTPECPECGGAMVLRTNRRTDEQFYGCLAYPKCKGTEEAAEGDPAPLTLPSDQIRRNDSRRWRNE